VFLDDLARHLREEVSEKKRRSSLSYLEGRPLFQVGRRGFLRALKEKRGRRIVAEVKQSSPSRGMIREVFEPQGIAKDYESHGAVAISVLTQQRFFGGDLEHLDMVHRVTGLPLLMKDFVIDPFQIYEARSHGSDAVLLIVAMVEDRVLHELFFTARELGLDVLVEVHSEEDLSRALKLEPDVVGINNRDLRDLRVDLSTTERILPHVPSEVLVISESGFQNREDLLRLEEKGVHAFLIGEWLMAGENPGERLSGLLSW